MNPPSREEIESAIGGKLPSDVPIEEVTSWPPQEDGSGSKFELVTFIKGKFALFKKSLAGKIIRYYIYAFGLGAPIWSPYDIVTEKIPNAVVIGTDKFADYSKVIYDRVLAPLPDPIGGYLVTTPPEFQLPPTGSPLSLDDLPIGSGVSPISGDNLQYLRSALG